MRWQTTVVVAVLVALVGGFYVYDVEYLGPAREKGERQKNRLWTVEPKDAKQTPVMLTSLQGQAVFLLPVVVLPGIALIAGIVVFARRRASG